MGRWFLMSGQQINRCSWCSRALGSLESKRCADVSDLLGLECGEASGVFPRILRATDLDVWKHNPSYGLPIDNLEQPFDPKRVHIRPWPVGLKNGAPFWEALHALADEGTVGTDKVSEAIRKYGIDPEKPNPLYS